MTLLGGHGPAVVDICMDIGTLLLLLFKRFLAVPKIFCFVLQISHLKKIDVNSTVFLILAIIRV